MDGTLDMDGAITTGDGITGDGMLDTDGVDITIGIHIITILTEWLGEDTDIEMVGIMGLRITKDSEMEFMPQMEKVEDIIMDVEEVEEQDQDLRPCMEIEEDQLDQELILLL